MRPGWVRCSSQLYLILASCGHYLILSKLVQGQFPLSAVLGTRKGFRFQILLRLGNILPIPKKISGKGDPSLNIKFISIPNPLSVRGPKVILCHILNDFVHETLLIGESSRFLASLSVLRKFWSLDHLVCWIFFRSTCIVQRSLNFLCPGLLCAGRSPEALY